MRYLDVKRRPAYWRYQRAIGAICPGCGRSGVYGFLVFDHCHEHGFVRGLVCTSCNVKLGQIDAVRRLEDSTIELGDPWASIVHTCPPCAARKSGAA